MSLYDRLSGLQFRIDGYDLHRLKGETSSGFTRTTTVLALHGGGHTGRGEDVTYETADHDALHDWKGEFPLAGSYTVDEFSEHVGGLDLFPARDPDREVFRNYRRWGVESAALDLALRQHGETLATALGRSYDPVHFVASTRLGEPPSTDRVERLLAATPDLAFKLDPTADWTDRFVDRVAALADVRILDLKGQYDGTEVDVAPDPALYERILKGFPSAIVEDPRFTAETRPLFDGHEDRVSWDYPITGVGAVKDLPFEPAWLNIKPSRFGSVAAVLDTVEYATDHGIRLYGGGQFELGIGRRHLHALASVLYPAAPNDVAPGEYNTPTVPDDLPASPLKTPADPRGLDWQDGG